MKIIDNRIPQRPIKVGDLFQDIRGILYIAVSALDNTEQIPTWAVQLETGIICTFELIEFPKLVEGHLVLEETV